MRRYLEVRDADHEVGPKITSPKLEVRRGIFTGTAGGLVESEGGSSPTPSFIRPTGWDSLVQTNESRVNPGALHTAPLPDVHHHIDPAWHHATGTQEARGGTSTAGGVVGWSGAVEAPAGHTERIEHIE